MDNNFKIGEIVVCVNDRKRWYRLGGLKKHEMYTIEGFNPYDGGLILTESKSPRSGCNAYRADRFRIVDYTFAETLLRNLQPIPEKEKKSITVEFEKFALTRADKNSKLTGSRKLGPAELTFAAMENDLETVTAVRYPVISEIKNELKDLGADKALMSGSGPTVFGIFPESFENQKRKIESVVVQLRQKFGEKVFVVDTRNGV